MREDNSTSETLYISCILDINLLELPRLKFHLI